MVVPSPFVSTRTPGGFSSHPMARCERVGNGSRSGGGGNIGSSPQQPTLFVVHEVGGNATVARAGALCRGVLWPIIISLGIVFRGAL